MRNTSSRFTCKILRFAVVAYLEKEIPGGKAEASDESILHAAVRELKEETGLQATRIVRQVTHMTFEIPRTHGRTDLWVKIVFEMEVCWEEDFRKNEIVFIDIHVTLAF